MPKPPIKPPAADSTNKPRPPARPGSALQAVLGGLAVDLGGTLLCSVALSVVYAVQLHGQGLSDEQIDQAMASLPPGSMLYVAGILLGLSMSLIGGYVCARIARRDEYRIGLVMAALSAGYGLATSGPVDGDDMTLLLTVTSLACSMLGVKYGAEYNRRAERAADAAGDAPSA